jgi:hypothetical protein
MLESTPAVGAAIARSEAGTCGHWQSMEGVQMAKKHKAPKRRKNLADGKTLGELKTLRGSGGGDITITKPIDKPSP